MNRKKASTMNRKKASTMNRKIFYLSCLCLYSGILAAQCAKPHEAKLQKEAVVQNHPQDHEHKHEHNHDHEHANHSTTSPGVSTQPIGHMGSNFTLKEKVELSDILANHKQFEGKQVQVSGIVMSQCIRSRRWFAISKDGSYPWIRIMTEPRFYLKGNAEKMNSTAEGMVILGEIPQNMARHLDEEHKLFGGNPNLINGPVQEVVIMATGVDFSNK